MNEFETTIQEAIRKIQEVEHDCLIHNFRLVKIKLPPDLFEELIKRTRQVVVKEESDYTSYIGIYMGVPVEKDDYIHNIQYVIEGDLKLL